MFSDLYTVYLIIISYTIVIPPVLLKVSSELLVLENTVKTWPQLHFAVFYKCVLLILHPPALISVIFRMRNRIFPCYDLIRLAYKKCSIIPRFTEIIRVRGKHACEHVIHSLALSFLRHTDVGATRSAASSLRFAVNMNGKHVIMKLGACDTKSVNMWYLTTYTT